MTVLSEMPLYPLVGSNPLGARPCNLARIGSGCSHRTEWLLLAFLSCLVSRAVTGRGLNKQRYVLSAPKVAMVHGGPRKSVTQLAKNGLALRAPVRRKPTQRVITLRCRALFPRSSPNPSVPISFLSQCARRNHSRFSFVTGVGLTGAFPLHLRAAALFELHT